MSAEPASVLKYRFECPRCLDTGYGTSEQRPGESLSIVVECWRCGVSYAGKLAAPRPAEPDLFTLITEIAHD